MGVETILAGIGTVASIVGGVQQSREAERQARLTREQRELRARQEARETIELEKKQKLAFLKSGVALQGSPLLVLAETRQRGQENIGAILRTGQTEAAGLQASGRQALIGGVTGGLGIAASGFNGTNKNSFDPAKGPPPRKPAR